jgi:hypothetical protein
MKCRPVRVGVALVLALGAGCSNLPPPMVGDPGPQLGDSTADAEYRTLVDRYSAQKQVFNGFDTIFFGGVTYESLPFREARIRRKDAFQMQPPEKLEKDLRAEQAEAAQYYEFMLGAYVQNPRFDDFDLKDSIWHIGLVTPAGEAAPVQIQRVGKANVNTRAYYPYMGDFWTVYRVRFSKTLGNQPLVTPETQVFTFILASSVGRAEFKLPAR